MNIANFYPGPSRIYSCIPEFIYEAYMSGILSANHRSDEFMKLMDETKSILRSKLLIPADYEIAFTSSATESWEIVSQSLVAKGSCHFYNGAFGKKWHGYANQLKKTSKVEFGVNDELPVAQVSDELDVICVTQNETSNGTEVSNEILKKLREINADKIIAVDVTSSIGGVKIHFENADYWYASVQKCLGLPAGLGVVILSPKAIEKAFEIGERGHYNSLISIIENTRKNQTQYTPNVLGIFLLNKSQGVSKGISPLHEKLVRRVGHYASVIQDLKGVDYLVRNESVRSKTVLALTHDDPDAVRAQASDAGIILGAGYGDWKSSSFRIANFPAIKTKEINKLQGFLEQNFQ
ncbi:MAG: aminotransferase class V-fold PLP-dependent enzyme [Cyclobacteriaceae bacterium]